MNDIRHLVAAFLHELVERVHIMSVIIVWDVSIWRNLRQSIDDGKNCRRGLGTQIPRRTQPQVLIGSHILHVYMSGLHSNTVLPPLQMLFHALSFLTDKVEQPNG